MARLFKESRARSVEREDCFSRAFRDAFCAKAETGNIADSSLPPLRAVFKTTFEAGRSAFVHNLIPSVAGVIGEGKALIAADGT